MTASVTLMEAYMIETLLAAGMSKADLIEAVKTEDIEAILEVDDSYDYLALIHDAKEKPHQIEEAIESGYTIKFISVYGIERLLKIKFGLDSGTDYTMEENSFSNLTLKQDDFLLFEKMLSPNWVIHNKNTTDSAVTFDVIHKTHSA